MKRQNAAIKRAKSQGFTDNSPSVRLLTRYKAYLWQLRIDQDIINLEKQDLGTLKAPDKKTTMAPGACPEGQGGGLLAGLLNSVTGSDLAAVCDIDSTRDKNKSGGSGEEGGRDHGED